MIPEQNRGKVILFNPSPWTGLSLFKKRVLPLALMHLAPPLEKKGYSVTIIDQFVDHSWRKNLDLALKEEPICFGVTSMTGAQIFRAVEICRIVRTQCPGLPLVWGGVHATIKPAQTLENPFVDILVIGEGEETFAELVEALESGSPLGQVNGIGYKEGGRQHFTPPRPFIDLNQAPDPAFHLVDMSRYQEKILGVNHTRIICSRGCIYDCAYCWDPVFHQRKHRVMDPEKVLNQMTRVVKDYGIQGFVFGDDNFFIDLNWAHNILERVVESTLNFHIGKLLIRADTVCRLDKDFLDLLVRAGVKRVVIGAESGSPRILRLIKKRITTEEIIESNRKLGPYPIGPAYLFMMGIPTETPEEVKMSVRLSEQLMKENPRATRAFNIYTPFPGTELYDMVVKMGFPEPKRLEEWAGFNYRNIYGNTPWITPETRKLVSILDYALMCSPRDNNLGKIRRDEPFSVLMASIYGPAARYRVRTMDTRLPIEPYIIRGIRKIMGRDRV